MTHEELMFRNNLATKLMLEMSTRPSLDEVVVERSFTLADKACAHIRADYEKLAEKLASKAAATQAARQAEFDALVSGLNACGSTSANTKPYTDTAQGAGQVDRRKVDCDCSQLRRESDKVKVEVRELTPEQALDMIASLIFPPKR